MERKRGFFFCCVAWASDFTEICRRGNPEDIRQAVLSGMDVNARDVYGSTPLIRGIQFGWQIEVIKTLLEVGADVNARSEGGWTPLMIAAQNGNTAVTSLLLEAGADVNAKDDSGRTPLDWAQRARMGRQEVVHLLSEAGSRERPGIAETYRERILFIVNSGKEPEYGLTPLAVAAALSNDLEEVKRALARTENIDAKDAFGFTPLAWAVLLNRNPEIIKFLVGAGANVNPELMNDDVLSLIDAAVPDQSYEVIEFLLKAGSQVNLRYTPYGYTPLMGAIEQQDVRLVELLLSYGANVNELGCEGYSSPLTVAVETQNQEIVAMLLKAGADVNERLTKEFTPLIVAAQNGGPEIVKFLLEKGADPNLEDKNSFWTPIHAAAQNPDPRVAELLLRAGAKVNVKNCWGSTPLMRAAERGCAEVAKLLLDAGAEVNAQDNEGLTPLMYAARGNHTALLKLLLEKGADPLLTDKEGKRAIDYAEEGTEAHTLLTLAAQKQLTPSPQVDLLSFLYFKGDVVHRLTFTLEGKEYTAIRLFQWVDPETGEVLPDRPGPWVFLDAAGNPVSERETLERLYLIAQANDMMWRLGKKHFKDMIAKEERFLKDMERIALYTEVLSLLGEAEGMALSAFTVSALAQGAEWASAPRKVLEKMGISSTQAVEELLKKASTSSLSKTVQELLEDPTNLMRFSSYTLLTYALWSRREQLEFFDRGPITTEEEARRWFSLEQKGMVLWTHVSDFLSRVEALEVPDWKQGVQTFLEGVGRGIPVAELLVSFKEHLEKLVLGTELSRLFMTLKEEFQKPLSLTPQDYLLEYTLEVKRFTASVLKTLIERLKDPLWTTRRDAAQALGEIGSEAKDAVPVLAELLNDRVTDVRRAVAWALGKVGPEAGEALPNLIRALQDEDSQVRAAAAEALGNIGPAAKEAVPALVEALGDSSDEVCVTAARSLAKVGLAAQQETIPVILKALGSSDEEVRKAAIEVEVSELELEKLVPILVEALRDSDWTVRRFAAEVLMKVGPKAKEAVPVLAEALRDNFKYVRRAAALALGNIGPEAKRALPALAEALRDRERKVRQAAALALRNIGREIGPEAQDIVPALVEALQDEDSQVRAAAAEALGNIGPAAKEAVPDLGRALKETEGTIVAWVGMACIEALGKIDPKAAMPILIEALGSGSARICETTARVLGSMGPEAKEAVPALIKVLKGRSMFFDDAKAAAAEALGNIGPAAKEAVPALVEALGDYSSIRKSAFRALVKMGSTAVPGLLEALRNNWGKVRWDVVLQILGEMGPEARDAVPFLKGLLQHESGGVRRAAAKALQKITGEDL